MELTSGQVTTLMLDICWLSVLLLIGKLLRVKVKLFQRLFLPASLIAGFIGLFLGTSALGRTGFVVIPQEMIKTWGTFPGHLINIVFASLFLGFSIPSIKTMWHEGGPQLCYGWIVGTGQYVVGLGLGIILLTPVFRVPEFFGCLLEIGFSGGHGTASGMKEVFNKQVNFPAGGDLGLMSATVGIIVAVVFGMWLINIAVRRGDTALLKKTDKIGFVSMDGLIPKEKRSPGSLITISPDALEPFAFHSAIISVAILFGWFLLNGLQSLTAGREPDIFKGFPLFPLAMIGGIIIQLAGDRLGFSKYFDKQTFDRIMGTALDYLVVSAIASIRIDVFLAYFWPFTLLMITGTLWVIAATYFIAPRMLPDVWFERSIVEYGMQTGVTAIGLLLLRVVDPHFKTPAAKAFGFKQMIYEPFLGGGFITAVMPILIVIYGIGKVFIGSILTVIFFFSLAYFSGWVHTSRRTPAVKS